MARVQRVIVATEKQRALEPIPEEDGVEAEYGSDLAEAEKIL